MPKTRAARRPPPDRYWLKRTRSKPFKRALATVVAQEIRSLATQRVADVVDGKLVRARLAAGSPRMINHGLLADLLIEGNRRVGRRLRRRHESLLGLLDAPLAADVDALLSEPMDLPPHMEDLVAKMMQQEFVRRLFTDIIFTAIVNFYRKVNPLFGAITMRVLEDQIKAFIQLFMPMLQKQATAFAVDKENQRILLDFTRAIIRQLLNEPLPHYAAMASPAQRRKAETLVRKAVGNLQLDSLIREATLAAWDDIYQTICDKRIGELLGLAENASWLADRCVEVILPTLARPPILKFLATEMALAAAESGLQTAE